MALSAAAVIPFTLVSPTGDTQNHAEVISGGLRHTYSRGQVQKMSTLGEGYKVDNSLDGHELISDPRITAALRDLEPTVTKLFPNSEIVLRTFQDPESPADMLLIEPRFSGSPEEAVERLNDLYQVTAKWENDVRQAITFYVEYI